MEEFSNHERPGSVATRMIITFLGFVCVASLGVWGLVSFVTHGTGSDQQAENTEEKFPTTGEDAFFYKSLGKTPEGFEEKAGGRRIARVNYTLEIKVADSRKEAEKVIDMLSDLGVEAYYTPLSRKGRVVYRVRSGVFQSKKTAEKASLALRGQKQVANRVIKLQ